eukprot:GABW01000905.1.p1 GENE.GABW01000905.1~~GABW01000905.1.p1  ORF type:complete len:125 (-),score=56.55 GABW01000905.1:58-432(-)
MAKVVRKIRTKTHFTRPKTLKLDRKPKYERKSVQKANKLDEYAILRHPLTTEAAMTKMENDNTLVFVCSPKANKNLIKAAVEKLHKVKVARVNTLIRPDAQKKAYIRLSPDYEALEIAHKIGII